MNRKEKVLYIDTLKECIKNSKGYVIIEFFAKDIVIQKYRRILSEKNIIVKKVKLKLLARILDVPKDMFYGQIYILIMNEVIELSQLYMLHHELTYDNVYKFGEVISSAYVLKPQLLAIRPTKLFKNIEQKLPVKLNRGFIQIIDYAIFTKEEVVDLVFDSAQKELNLRPKLIYGKVLNYHLNSGSSDVSKLNSVITHIANLAEYIYYENGLSALFDPQLHALDYAHYESIKSYIPTDIKLIQNLVTYGPKNLVSKYGLVPKTKAWKTNNLTTLLYLLYLNIYDVKNYAHLETVFTDLNTFNTTLAYYECTHPDMYSLFNKIYLKNKQSDKVQTTSKKVATEDFDDLF